MNKSIIRDELRLLLEAINEQFEAIQSCQDRIPQIELDMLMENIRKFYENIHLLNRINDSFDALEKTGGIVFPKHQEIQPEVAAPSPPARMATVPDPSPVVIHYQETVETKEEQPGAEGMLYPEEAFDFTAKLKEAREKALGTDIGKGKPAGLKSAVTINDKFLFINELFDGNLKDYNEHIEALNGFTDLKTAFDYLDLLRQKNRWETDGKGFRRLREILEKIY
ncbi:MAG: hypothetical protein ACM3N9_03675 [Syntrophothermus sp.]